MKSLLLAFGLALGATVHAEGPIPAFSSAPAEVAKAPPVKPSAVNALAPKIKLQPASSKDVHVAPSPAPVSTPTVQARSPGPADLCRAGMALAKGRKLDEMTIQEEKRKMFSASYVPWPNAPADARLYKCKVVGNAIVSGEPKGRGVKWNGERVTWALSPQTEELTVHVSFSTGKGRSRTYAFSELEQVCNGCAGFPAAPVNKAKAAATTKRQ